MKYSSASATSSSFERDVEQRVLAGDLEDLVGDLLDDLRPGVVVLVDAVTEALEEALAVLHRLDEVRHVLDASRSRRTCSGRPRWRRRGAARRARHRRRRSPSTGRRATGADDAHRRRRAVLLVIGVQDEQHVDRPCERGVGLVTRLGDLPHHREEVLREASELSG